MDRPVFLMGSMGSGTTLLRLILDSHPNLAIGQETGFMRAANANYFIPFWKSGGVWLERLGLTEGDLDESVRAFYDDVFTKFAQGKGAQRWGDKTPYHIWHMANMARIFPDAQFVATTRHPGAVANSLGRFKWKWERGLGHWQRANSELLAQASELGDRIALFRYEDLVADPKAVLVQVLDFLDEPWDDAVLAHHKSKDQPQVVEGRTKSSDPIDPARTGTWLAKATPQQLALLDRETGGLPSFLGYSNDAALPVEPLNKQDPEKLTISGDDIRDRMKAMPGAVPPKGSKPTFENSLYTPDAFAAQLRGAYEAGRDGGHVRATYRRRVEGPRKKKAPAPPASLMTRARRKAARMLDPGQSQG